MPWPKTGATTYHAKLGLPSKGRAIIGLAVCISWDVSISGPAKRYKIVQISYILKLCILIKINKKHKKIKILNWNWSLRIYFQLLLINLALDKLRLMYYDLNNFKQSRKKWWKRFPVDWKVWFLELIHLNFTMILANISIDLFSSLKSFFLFLFLCLWF